MEREARPDVGLCSICRHARRVTTPRSVFWMCALAATDARFERYPRLPVTRCAGHERGEPADQAPAREPS
jgi:hypothetical protein